MTKVIRYTEEEYAHVLNYIERNYGPILQIYSGSLASSDKMTMKQIIDLDLCLIPPTPTRNYYSIVTLGFGAYRMTVPEQARWQNVARAELCFALPPEFNIADCKIEELWLVRVINLLIYYVINKSSWFGWGHSFFDGAQSFNENTELSCMLLVSPGDEMEQAATLPNGDEVNFYCLMPLYKEEADYVRTYGTDHLIDRFISNEEVLAKFKAIPIIDEKRPNVCLSQDKNTKAILVADKYYIGDVVDYAGWHKENIDKNSLMVDEINTLNHLAIFLRFMISKKLMSEAFILENGEELIKIFTTDSNEALREFIREKYDGCLLYTMFNDKGFSFVNYYYNKLTNNVEDELHSYTADIDTYAKKYFSDNWQYELELKRYAYLYVPFDESYYYGMEKKIQENYENWRNLFEFRGGLKYS